MLVAMNTTNVNVLNEKKPLNIIISSLSLGGAEKIVVDWAISEGNRGNKVEIAVLHNKEKEHKITASNVTVIRRKKNTKVSTYLSGLITRWGTNNPVSTHLLNGTVHQFLWDNGLKTVPVIHNDKKGWKISIEELNHPNVVGLIACAKHVKQQLIEEGYKGDIATIRHLPLINEKVFDMEQRIKLRKQFQMDEDTLCVASIGAIKEQKNYSRIIEIAKTTERKIKFFIFGDYVNENGLQYKNELFKSIEEHNLFEKIIFMGFKDDIFNYFPAFDCVLNCSNYEGYSIATQEALLSGIPVIATNVSGQSEIELDGLTLIEPNDDNMRFVDEIEQMPVRNQLKNNKKLNASRIWSLSLAYREPVPKEKTKTLFLTANLNAGGAQRSLVNLITQLKSDVALAVCNSTTNNYFPEKLHLEGIEHFQLSDSRDVFDLTYAALIEVYKRNVDNLVLWNVDPKMKLLLSEFLPSGVKYFDVSPGGYAFEELDNTVEFQESTTIKTKDFYSRLDHLVLKYDADTRNIQQYNVETMVIRNGVEDWSKNKSFDKDNKDILVSGRLVESKHIVPIIKAFKEFNNAKGGEYKLHFFGQAEERNKDYLDEINQAALNQKIVFHGADPELSFMELNFAMTIVLGTHQGCPNAVLESASGLIPVLANDSGGTREIIKDGHSGVLIPDNFTHIDLVSGMHKMVSLNRNQLISNAKNIVNNNFSMSLMNDNYSLLFGHDSLFVKSA